MGRIAHQEWGGLRTKNGEDYAPRMGRIEHQEWGGLRTKNGEDGAMKMGGRIAQRGWGGLQQRRTWNTTTFDPKEQSGKAKLFAFQVISRKKRTNN